MQGFVRRLLNSSKARWGTLTLLGALTLPVSSTFAHDYGDNYGRSNDYRRRPPPVVVYPEYGHREWRGGRDRHRHHWHHHRHHHHKHHRHHEAWNRHDRHRR